MTFVKGGQNWRDEPLEDRPKISQHDIRSLGGMTIGSTVRRGVVNTNTLNVYWAGRLKCDITGGTLNASTPVYILEIFLYHHFSQYYKGLQLIQCWHGQEKYEPGDPLDKKIVTAPYLGPEIGLSSPDSGSGQGSITSGPNNGILIFEEGVVDPNDPQNMNTEYMYWLGVVTRSSGTIVIPPQSLILIPQLYYFSKPLEELTALPPLAEGGGGSVIYERLNFYI